VRGKRAGRLSPARGNTGAALAFGRAAPTRYARSMKTAVLPSAHAEPEMLEALDAELTAAETLAAFSG